MLCRIDNFGVLRVTGQEDVSGYSGLPDTDLNLSGAEDFILLLGQFIE